MPSALGTWKEDSNRIEITSVIKKNEKLKFIYFSSFFVKSYVYEFF